jgi:hypothetical protein
MMFKPQKDQLNTLPPGRYDATFLCYNVGWDSHSDSIIRSTLAEITFFDDSGSRTRRPRNVRVTVNGIALTNGVNEPVPVHFPEPVTWQIEGNERYPSATRTLIPETPIQFLAPRDHDTISISQGFEVRYNAPKSDSLQFLTMCFAKVAYKRHPTDTLEEGGQDYSYISRNTGRFTVPPLSLNNAFSRFEPKSLTIIIMAAHGDTVHVGNAIYGFITEAHTTRTFNVKP